MNEFFPNPGFGWAFVLTLLAILATASYFDLRYFRIPNWLTVPALAAGVVFNIVRGAWVGAQMDEVGVWWGALDGLTFALLGFLLGFGLFFFFWLIQFCKGGDLKLFSAVASWLGWNCSYWVWLLSFGILATILTVRLVQRAIFGKPRSEPQPDAEGSQQRRGRNGPFPGYSLPLTIAVILVFSWLYYRELRNIARAATPVQAMRSEMFDRPV